MPKLTKRQQELAALHKEFSDEELLQEFQKQPIVVSVDKQWSAQDDADCAQLAASSHFKTLLRVRDRMKQEALQAALEADKDTFEYLKAAIRSFESFTVFIETHGKLANPK